MSKKGTMPADRAARRAEFEAQAARMREMLRLIAPSSGTAALGAMRKAFPDAPLRDRVQALKSYH